MFSEQEDHAYSLILPYLQNTRNKQPTLSKLFRLKRKGAYQKRARGRLDGKIKRCYPRGKATQRMLELEAASWE